MNSQIILAKNINIDKQYTNVLSYSEAEMIELCRQNQIANSNSFSFLRPNGTILVDFPYADCLDANYMAFQNPDYSNKWFFAWIDDVIYKGDKNCELRFTIDAWSTWYDRWTRKPCYVIREHTNDDTIGLNTVPENIDVGEMIAETETEDSTYTSDTAYYIAVQSSWKIKDGSDGTGTESDKGSQFSGISVYNKSVFGTELFLIKITNTNDFVNLGLFLLRTNSDGHIADVDNIFILPDISVSQASLTSHSASVGDKSFTFYTIPYSITAKTFNSIVLRPSSYSGITIKNNKCFCYPYSYIQISNNQGSTNIYKYEDFANSNCTFENQFSVSIGGSGRIVPLNYKGMVTNDDEALPLGKYPTCGWSSDAFTNWLTQNSVNLAVSNAMSIVGSGASYSNLTGKKQSEQISGAQNIGISIAGEIAGTIGQFRTASLMPNISGGQPTGDVSYAMDRICFTIRQMRSKNEYMKIIDDYFTRFGYAVKRIKTANITGRRYWNYVEISSSDEIGYGDVPSKYMETINNACRRGVTIWHEHDKVGDYSLQNSII